MAMRKRYRRRRRAGAPSPWLIAAICIGLVIVITVVIGNLLKLWLDDDTYIRLTEGEPQEAPLYEIRKSAHSDINAYPYILGSSASSIAKTPNVSISLNSPDGVLFYHSPVSTYQAIEGNEKLTLANEMKKIESYTTYISGVFYPQAFAYDNADMRFAVTAQESALMREFLRAGGRDLVLAGIPLQMISQESAVEYLRAIKIAAGDRAVGVAIPLSYALRPNSWEMIGALLSVGDFCVLDVSEAPKKQDGELMTAQEILVEADFFLKQYDMRLMLTDQQKELQALVEEQAISDFQIIQAPKASSNEEAIAP